jgi:quinol-cytochrome oxidoreductase complex cytochrome b subunit
MGGAETNREAVAKVGERIIHHKEDVMEKKRWTQKNGLYWWELVMILVVWLFILVASGAIK